MCIFEPNSDDLPETGRHFYDLVVAGDVLKHQESGFADKDQAEMEFRFEYGDKLESVERSE